MVEHKIKLEKSVKVILGVFAFGVFLNVFAQVFSVKEAYAELSSFFGTEQNQFIVKFELGGQKDGLGNNGPIEFRWDGCN